MISEAHLVGIDGVAFGDWEPALVNMERCRDLESWPTMPYSELPRQQDSQYLMSSQNFDRAHDLHVSNG